MAQLYLRKLDMHVGEINDGTPPQMKYTPMTCQSPARLCNMPSIGDSNSHIAKHREAAAGATYIDFL